MSKNNVIDVFAFNKEIGKLGYDPDGRASFFQYNPVLLQSGQLSNLFPLIIKKIKPVQVFRQFHNATFRGLPPVFADSLPDVFGNLIFKAWLESAHKDFNQITMLEQLCYVGKRGMGALEYMPAKNIPKGTAIDLKQIIEIVGQVLDNKKSTQQQTLDTKSLVNIFKIGSSAGGARPKILISEHKKTGAIIPGDLEYSEEYDHYLVKLGIDEAIPFRETIEYIYYLMAVEAGIEMMPCKMIDGKHFATLRFDRINGEKKHVLTACGMAGWDFENPEVSSYENLFELAQYLRLEQRDIDQLFKRMVFNIVFANHDDHLKNHAFIYNEKTDTWKLAPAYDITYSLNPVLHFTKTSRALSVNGKRTDITTQDIKAIADKYTVSKAATIIEFTRALAIVWQKHAAAFGIPANVIGVIYKSFWLK